MIEKINDIFSCNTVKRISGRRFADEMEPAGSQDAVSFSSFARELAEMGQEIKKVPEVREQLVEEIKNQVQSGHYNIQNLNVASLLVKAGITRSDS